MQTPPPNPAFETLLANALSAPQPPPDLQACVQAAIARIPTQTIQQQQRTLQTTHHQSLHALRRQAAETAILALCIVLAAIPEIHILSTVPALLLLAATAAIAAQVKLSQS